MAKNFWSAYEFTTAGRCGGQPGFGPWDPMRDVVPRCFGGAPLHERPGKVAKAGAQLWELALTSDVYRIDLKHAAAFAHLGLEMSRECPTVRQALTTQVAGLREDSTRLHFRWHLLLEALNRGPLAPDFRESTIGERDFRRPLLHIIELVCQLISPFLLPHVAEPGIVRIIALAAWPTHILPPHSLFDHL
jgi:hypothetical protein